MSGTNKWKAEKKQGKGLKRVPSRLEIKRPIYKRRFSGKKLGALVEKAQAFYCVEDLRIWEKLAGQMAYSNSYSNSKSPSYTITFSWVWESQRRKMVEEMVRLRPEGRSISSLPNQRGVLQKNNFHFSDSCPLRVPKSAVHCSGSKPSSWMLISDSLMMNRMYLF